MVLCLLRDCGGGFLGGFCGCRCLPAALGLGRGCGRFADKFSRQHTGDEQLGTMVIKIDCGTLGIGCRYDTKAEKVMLDGLAFLHYLHNCLLGTTRYLSRFAFLSCFPD